MSTLTLQRIWPGAWRVHADGTIIGTVSGAQGLGGYGFQTYGPVGTILSVGVHSVSPRRYPTPRLAADALAALAGT